MDDLNPSPERFDSGTQHGWQVHQHRQAAPDGQHDNCLLPLSDRINRAQNQNRIENRHPGFGLRENLRHVDDQRDQRQSHGDDDRQLYIHPDECIDCGVCEPECPVEAIKPDTEPGLEKWLKLNAEYAQIWPNITAKKEPPADSKEWEGVAGKEQYFSAEPGTGN